MSQYVELYAMYVMIEAAKPLLVAMRQGLHDVLAPGAIARISANFNMNHHPLHFSTGYL
jgi:hypothetical protein